MIILYGFQRVSSRIVLEFHQVQMFTGPRICNQLSAACKHSQCKLFFHLRQLGNPKQDTVVLMWWTEDKRQFPWPAFYFLHCYVVNLHRCKDAPLARVQLLSTRTKAAHCCSAELLCCRCRTSLLPMCKGIKLLLAIKTYSKISSRETCEVHLG